MDARRDLDQLRLIAEHERIARDLNDNVIQRLFALGLCLQGVQPLADGRVAERISGSVEAIDEVIREIRETIFELNRPGHDGIRAELKRLASDTAGQFGMKPRLHFVGPVDTVIQEDLAGHVMAVARETLFNAVRHGRAKAAVVTIDVSTEMVMLTVSDDGGGLLGAPAEGHGLSNMRARAEMLDSFFRITSTNGSGVVIEWGVPSLGPEGPVPLDRMGPSHSARMPGYAHEG